MSPEPHDPELLPDERWTEPRLERLLGWFFDQEMPPALRDSAESHLRVQVAPRLGPATARRHPGPVSHRWLVPLCALALLGCGWLLWQSPQRQSAVVVKSNPLPAVELEAAGFPLQVELVSYRGSSGSFEQRTELRWTSSSFFEPASGVWVEWSAPELVIDVEPVAASDPAALPQGL